MTTHSVVPQAANDGPRSAVVVDGQHLSLDDVAAVARLGTTVTLSDDPAVLEGIEASVMLNRRLIAEGVPLYGITTGFGDSVGRQISPEKAAALQEHAVRMLGNGTGPTTPVDAARAVMLIRANNSARGHSAVRPELLNLLLRFLNEDITPVIPEEGSVGASGDLVPLSYVAATLTGTRLVQYQGEVRPAADALPRRRA